MEIFPLNWRTSLALKERIGFILDNGYMTDVTIRIIHNTVTEFRAHSIFLSMASPVFERILFKKNKADNYRSKAINIQYVKPDIFIHLLQYIYGRDIVYSNTSEVCDLYRLAEEYMMLDLKEFCLQYMIDHIDPTNVCLYLETAIHCDLVYLQEKALKLICKKTEEVITHENFLRIEPETLAVILDQENIAIKEIGLFKAVEIWIKNSVVKKSVKIEDPICKLLLRKICYLNMTPEEFASGPVESKLLSTEFIDDINARFDLLKWSIRLNSVFDNNNNFLPKKTVNIDTSSLKTIVSATDGWKKVFLSAQEDVKLSELEIFSREGIKQNKYEEEITLKIKDERSDDWEYEYEFNDIVSFSSKINVKLDKTFQLLRNKKYIMEIYSSGGYRKTVNLNGINLFNDKLSVRFDRFAMWSPYVPLSSLTLNC